MWWFLNLGIYWYNLTFINIIQSSIIQECDYTSQYADEEKYNEKDQKDNVAVGHGGQVGGKIRSGKCADFGFGLFINIVK